METLLPHERKGLEFLYLRGSDTVGVIDSDEKMAAAYVWTKLAKRGLVLAIRGINGPTYYITEAGRKAIGK